MMVPLPETHTLEEKPIWRKDPNSCFGCPVACWMCRWASRSGTQGWRRGSAAVAGMPQRGRRSSGEGPMWPLLS